MKSKAGVLCVSFFAFIVPSSRFSSGSFRRQSDMLRRGAGEDLPGTALRRAGQKRYKERFHLQFPSFRDKNSEKAREKRKNRRAARPGRRFAPRTAYQLQYNRPGGKFPSLFALRKKVFLL